MLIFKASWVPSEVGYVTMLWLSHRPHHMVVRIAKTESKTILPKGIMKSANIWKATNGLQKMQTVGNWWNHCHWMTVSLDMSTTFFARQLKNGAVDLPCTPVVLTETKLRAEPKTFGTADLKHIRYCAAYVTNSMFYLNHVMQGRWIVATFVISFFGCRFSWLFEAVTLFNPCTPLTVSYVQ